MVDAQVDAQVDARIDAGQWLRAVRRSRSLNQRELAALAQVPLSTIAAIESGRRHPGLDLMHRILTATGHRLVVMDDETNAVLVTDADDAPRDRSGRRLPAHLGRVSNPTTSEPSFVHRRREARGPLREHPWFGPFRSRAGCFGPADAPCENCVDNCRHGSEPG